MTGIPAEQAPTTTVGAPPSALPEPSDLHTAIRVGQKMLATYGNTSGYDIYAYAQAHGGLAEALRILLRALNAEPAAEGVSGTPDTPRCPAAHPEDPTPCSGQPTVTVLDAKNASADGCQHHAARLLASLDGGRVYGLPHATPGTAIRVFKAAASIRPFPWVDGPRTRDEQLSREEVRARGEGQ
ncbi:hypothetical protein [Streptomyces ossamyceticus]|uniref:hypothetical protein n=1 Tax=Streptomyces ossamyceticus TaxID=249581 RepID=UPI0034285236